MLDIEIFQSSFEHNMEVILDRLSKEKLIAVLKDNAYGNGLCKMSRWIDAYNVKHFGVSTISEAIRIKSIIPDSSILILKNVPSECISTAIINGFTLTISSLEYLNNVENLARIMKCPCKVHLKFDTGLNRWGLQSNESTLNEIMKTHHRGFIVFEGIFTQMQNTYNMKNNPMQQIKIEMLLNCFKSFGLHFPMVHLNCTPSLNYDINKEHYYRIGAGLLGTPNNSTGYLQNLKPLMHIKTRLYQIKQVKCGDYLGYNQGIQVIDNTLIGLLSSGYANGIRSTSTVFVNEKQVKVIYVFLDTTIVDLGSESNARVGDLVNIGLYEMGENSRTPCQVTCDVGNSVCNQVKYK